MKPGQLVLPMLAAVLGRVGLMCHSGSTVVLVLIVGFANEQEELVLPLVCYEVVWGIYHMDRCPLFLSPTLLPLKQARDGKVGPKS